jgi:hypothetical protein
MATMGLALEFCFVFCLIVFLFNISLGMAGPSSGRFLICVVPCYETVVSVNGTALMLLLLHQHCTLMNDCRPDFGPLCGEACEESASSRGLVDYITNTISTVG